MPGKVYQSEDELRADVAALKVGESVWLDTLHFSAPKGGRAYIKKVKRNDYVLNDMNNKHRNRWGTLDEIVADGMHFTWNGNLPPPSGPRW